MEYLLIHVLVQFTHADSGHWSAPCFIEHKQSLSVLVHIELLDQAVATPGVSVDMAKLDPVPVVEGWGQKSGWHCISVWEEYCPDMVVTPAIQELLIVFTIQLKRQSKTRH